MKAAILTEFNKPLTVDNVEPFGPIACGQVLVEVKYSAICGAQINEISAASGDDPYLPHLLGHEGAGVVSDIGPGVTNVKVGDHVVMHWRQGRGIEAPFPKYHWRDTIIGGGRVTTFNEQSRVSENRLTPIDRKFPLDVATLLGCSVTTGLGLINNEARLKIGQSIVVAGCGGTGLSVVYGAAMVSANPIIGLDVRDDKLSLAERLGATHTVNVSNIPIESAVGGIVNSTDVFVDCTGLPDVINAGYILTAPGGKMILVGQPPVGVGLMIANARQHYQGKTILDSQGGLTNPNVDIPSYLKLYEADRLRLNDFITHRYPLDRINEALDTVRSGEAAKCLLEL